MEAGDVGGNENNEHIPPPRDGESGPDDTDVNYDAPWGEEDGMEFGRQEAQKAALRLAVDEQEQNTKVAQARMVPDLVERAKKLKRIGAIDFPEEKPVNSGGVTVMQPLNSHPNYWEVFRALFGEEVPGRPHYDTFFGAPVDQDSKEIDGRYSFVELTMALSNAGLKGLKAQDVCTALIAYTKATQRNSLQDRIKEKLPEWDGVERMGVELIDLFECFDTPLNRDFGKYFWLSLYSRMMYPGAYAPMALALFGAQGAGKTYMSKLICEEVLGNPMADSIPLDLADGSKEFIRKITGKSVIANAGEMTGFGRGDLNKIKDFMTRTSDPFDQKYEKVVTQPRQWIIVMDGNKYEGTQRDETGNRRIYPMFCGQLPDEDGKHKWQMNFKVGYDGFRERFWQIMAECKAWLESHNHGMAIMSDSEFMQHIGYRQFVDGVMRQVQEFSRKEMENGSGVVGDPVLDVHLIPAIYLCHKRGMLKYRASGHFGSGDYIKATDLSKVLRELSGERTNEDRLKQRMAALGAPFTGGGGKNKKAFDGGSGAFFWKDQPEGTAMTLFEDEYGSADKALNDDVESVNAENNGGF